MSNRDWRDGPTPEEQDAFEASITEAVTRFQSNLDHDICPHCLTPIQQWNQVGRCVYAAPCGCRLYQGKVPENKKGKST